MIYLHSFRVFSPVLLLLIQPQKDLNNVKAVYENCKIWSPHQGIYVIVFHHQIRVSNLHPQKAV